MERSDEAARGMRAVSLSLGVVLEGRLALEGANEIGRQSTGVEHLQSPANEVCSRKATREDEVRALLL